MDLLKTVTDLMTQGCYMASLDIYSTWIATEHQKCLNFMWRDKLCQHTCLPNGLASAPRIFIKLLKQVSVAKELFLLILHRWLLSSRRNLRQEPMSRSHGAFIDRFIFRSNLIWTIVPWECHNQLQDTNWRNCVTGPELLFFHKRKDVLKIDQSVKMPWHRLSMGAATSCSSAPVYGECYDNVQETMAWGSWVPY